MKRTKIKRKANIVRKGKGLGGSTYGEHYPEKAYRLCLLGLTDKDLAMSFDVNPETIDNWKSKHKRFREAILAGKKDADANVAASLYQRALGYEHDDTHIVVVKGIVKKVRMKKYYPPETTACIYWLNNRTRQNEAPWSNKQSVELSGPNAGPINLKSDAVNTKGLDAEQILQLVNLGVKLKEG